MVWGDVLHNRSVDLEDNGRCETTDRELHKVQLLADILGRGWEAGLDGAHELVFAGIRFINRKKVHRQLLLDIGSRCYS